MDQTYIVKAGDTLCGISNQFGVSIADIERLNNVDASSLKVGQVLKIPNVFGTNPHNMVMYTVQKGDSLYSIAMKYNTTVQELINLNHLKNDDLQIGQVLKIPEMYTPADEMTLPSYTSYTVKKNDNLYSIARDNNIDITVLMRDNALTNDNLTVGQVLKIRIPSTEPVEVDECFGDGYSPAEDEIVSETIYTVKKGDNLYNIAKQYNTSVSEIINLNNLVNANLSIGQQLKVPSSSGNLSQVTYTVNKGDNLYDIAKKFNTTVDSIKRKNNLSSNMLSIGQKLII